LSLNFQQRFVNLLLKIAWIYVRVFTLSIGFTQFRFIGESFRLIPNLIKKPNLEAI
jgi:hypothetical protein